MYKNSFTKRELASLDVWKPSNLWGDDQDDTPSHKPKSESLAPAPVVEPLPILTVEEIEAMQQQAYKEAYEHGKQEGFEQGLVDGKQQGYDETVPLIKQQAHEFADLIKSLTSSLQELDAEVEKELITLVMGIAAQILNTELKIHPNHITATVKAALKLLPLASQKLLIHLHPKDCQIVREWIVAEDVSAAWSLIEDTSMSPGGCKIDTEVSHINASIEHRIAQVLNNVLGNDAAVGHLDAFIRITTTPEVTPESNHLFEFGDENSHVELETDTAREPETDLDAKAETDAETEAETTPLLDHNDDHS
ncbi:MAG: flagellar assembly protein FliH [Methylovulum sp.]|nr:flagellar assembly protein FliH [Methylovulum sp.]